MVVGCLWYKCIESAGKRHLSDRLFPLLIRLSVRRFSTSFPRIFPTAGNSRASKRTATYDSGCWVSNNPPPPLPLPALTLPSSAYSQHRPAKSTWTSRPGSPVCPVGSSWYGCCCCSLAHRSLPPTRTGLFASCSPWGTKSGLFASCSPSGTKSGLFASCSHSGTKSGLFASCSLSGTKSCLSGSCSL